MASVIKKHSKQASCSTNIKSHTKIVWYFQFYEFFASVESETMRLMCVKNKGHQSRIIGSTEVRGQWYFS